MKKRIINLFSVLGIMLITASFLFSKTNQIKLKKVKTSNNYQFSINEKYEKNDKTKVNDLSDMVYFDKENFKIITVFVDSKSTYKNDFNFYKKYKLEDNSKDKENLVVKEDKNSYTFTFTKNNKTYYMKCYLFDDNDTFMEVLMWSYNEEDLQEFDKIIESRKKL